MLILLHPSFLAAQGIAPASLAGSVLAVQIENGHPPFAGKGAYQLFISVAGTNYTVLGREGPLSSGSCAYSATGAVGTAILADASGGSGITVTLTFASLTNGTLGLTNASGFQTGMFTRSVYASAGLPEFLMPAFTNGQFQVYLSGQPGYVYAVQVSSNLANWQPLLSLALDDLSASFTDARGRGQYFYRARLTSTAFAPADLTNKTLNLAVTGGASPLSTNGICQWMAATNGDGFQVIGGAGVSNSAGTYTYRPTDPNSAVLTCQDSRYGALTERLVFTSPESGYFFTTNAAGYQAGTFTMADGPVTFLGNVRFTADAGRSQSLNFAADGSAARFSVTNAAGWVWTLNIPNDALLSPQTISMTPFASVEARNARLPVTAGVQLSPAGIQFCDWVTLTATAPAPLGAHATLLMANDDGSDLYLVPTTNSANGFSINLLHFSSAAATDPSDQQLNNLVNQYLPQIQAAYQNAVKQAKALQRAVVLPPEPPDYDWNCDPSGQQDQIAAYTQSLFAKETAVVQQLLSNARMLELVGVQESPAVGDVALGVIETAMYRKVDTLLGSYSGDPKKWYAVVNVALKVEHDDELLGGSGRPDWWPKIQNWGLRNVDYLWDQLRNYHKYSKAWALPILARQLALIGVDIDVGNLLDKLAKALTFKLTLDMKFQFKDWDSGGTVDAQVAEEAKGTVGKLVAGMNPPYTIVTNHIPIVSGSWAKPLSECSYSLDAGQSSTWSIALGLQPCGKPPEAFLLLTGPNPPIETWTGCQSAAVPSPWLGVVYGTAFICVSGQNGAGGLYDFPIQDGNAELVNQTVSGDSSLGRCADPFQKASGTIQILIEHNPQ